MERDYKKDSEVDKYNLDKEYEEIPSIYMHWAEAAADAKADRIRKEEYLKNLKVENKKNLEECYAKLDAEVRDWEVYGLDKKPTEAQIRNVIITHKEYIDYDRELNEQVAKATEEWIQAIRNEEVLAGARAAMGKRSSSIEGLAQLFLKDYYPRQPKQMQEEKQEEQTEDQKQGLKKSRMSRKRRRV